MGPCYQLITKEQPDISLLLASHQSDKKKFQLSVFFMTTFQRIFFPSRISCSPASEHFQGSLDYLDCLNRKFKQVYYIEFTLEELSQKLLAVRTRPDYIEIESLSHTNIHACFFHHHKLDCVG